MTTATFDTLKYSKRLQELGFTREQAEGFTEIQSEIVSDGLATKNDLHTEIQSVRSEIQELRAEMKKLESQKFKAYALKYRNYAPK